MLAVRGVGPSAPAARHAMSCNASSSNATRHNPLSVAAINSYIEQTNPLGKDFSDPAGLDGSDPASIQQALAEGLFEPSRKKPIPVLPRRIGVVTSPRATSMSIPRTASNVPKLLRSPRARTRAMGTRA